MRMLNPDESGQTVSNITANLVDLVSELQSISALVDVFGQGFNVKFMMDNADTIDGILAGGGTIHRIIRR